MLGPYEILAPLGAGGMGEVYRARDPRVEREVAIKVLPEHLARDPQALGRFEREAKAVAALSHPNILAIFDFGSQEGVSYAVTELLEGRTLRGRLEEGALGWREAVEIAAAAADGLAAAHAKGITHRDLKPENLFLTSDGRVKILDFGLARVGGAGAGAAEETVSEALTRDGTILGTVGYMSPEQARGDAAEAPSDIFSLGCVLYEMVGGQGPFRRGSAVETLAAILRDEAPPLGAETPAELQRVIAHCLEKNAAQRFQSARDLAFALRAMSTAAALPKPSGKPDRRWVLAAGAVAVVAAAVVLVRGLRQPAAIDTLAVLPFVNAGNGPATEYLSDGITESLIGDLARLPGLRVKSRDAVFRYKGQRQDVRAVGRDLGVRAVLRGRLAERAGELSITVELVDARDSNLLWTEQYKRKSGELLAVEGEIAGEVSRRLRPSATAAEQRQLVRRPTESAPAYQLYLRGRQAWWRRTEEALKSSVEFFNQAIEKDPGYARAWAGLANSYNMLAAYGVLPPRDAFPRAKAAAQQALELDDSLAEPHASLGRARTEYDWDWAGAEREYRRALELNPHYGTAHYWYAMHLAAVGRPEDAIREAHLAREVEPLSLVYNAGLGFFYFFARRYEEAAGQFRKAIEMDPNYPWGHTGMGAVHLQNGRHDEAIAGLEKGLELSRRGLLELTYVGHAPGVAGRRAEARRVLEEMTTMSRSRWVRPDFLAFVHLGLGEKDQVFVLLEKAYAEKAVQPWLLPDPRWDSVREDPRWRDLMQRLGLP